MKFPVCIFLFIAALCLSAAPVAFAQPTASPETDPIWLVRDGTFRGKIFLPENPAPEERDAAATLALWVNKVTGATPKIVTEDAAVFAPGIYVGATRHAAQRKISAPRSPGETWHWEPAGHGALFLLGNSPLATRLAVGDFLQIHLGVTFLLPGEWGAEWLPLRVVQMPAVSRTVEPGYKWRFLSGVGTGAVHQDWMRNNGLGAFPLFTHALHGVFDAEIAKSRPDFFPLVGGERRLPSGRGPWEPQPNLAAPGAATHAAHRAAAFFEQEPAAPMFPLGINDSKVWDDSPAMEPFFSPGTYFRGIPDYSNYVFVFMNRVATALWPKPAHLKGQPAWDATRWGEPESFAAANDTNELNDSKTPPLALPLPLVPPTKFLGCLAYANCERLPDFPLHPNIFPVLTADRSQWRDSVFRRHDSRLLRHWAHSGVRHFGIYDYYYGREFPIPRIFFDEEIDSIRWGVENGATLFYAELYPDWGFDAPKAWLATRLLLYPTQNSALLLNHFFNEAYGPAAAPMREFFDAASACWDAAGPARWLKFWHSEGIGALVSPAQQAAMRTALGNAEAAFPGTGWPGKNSAFLPANSQNERIARQQIRVRMTSLAFAATERFLEWHRLRIGLQRHRLDTPADARAMLADITVERRLRREFEQARELWNQSAVNPGTNTAAGNAPFPAGVGFSALERLLQKFAHRADEPDGAEWAEVFNEVALFATRRGAAPLVRVAANPDMDSVIFKEKFDADSFPEPDRRPPSTVGAATRLRAPWRTTLEDCETLRFGFVRDGAGAAGNVATGFLRVSGADAAILSRDISGIAGNSQVVAKVFVRGRVSPSTRASFALRFLDADGKRLPEAHVSAILHADANEWRPIVALGRIPPGAVAARVTLECRDQEDGESLDWDNLTVSTFAEK